MKRFFRTKQAKSSTTKPSAVDNTTTAAMFEGFDETWYRDTYKATNPPEAKQEVFDHYLIHSRQSAYSPNKNFNEAWYLTQYPDVASAVQKGDFHNGFDHYLQYGKNEGRHPNARWMQLKSPADKELIRAEFDAEWYRSTYPGVIEWCEKHGADSIDHYFSEGIRRYYSPNADFNEKAYLGAYRDVTSAITSGQLLCGFQHYVRTGRNEGRNPSPNLQDRLEQKYPGITRPVALDSLRNIESKLRPISATKIRNGKLRVNVLLPTLDPDIFFGGYTSVLHLIRRLYENRIPVRILICDDELFDAKIAVAQIDTGAHKYIYDCEIANVTNRTNSIRIHDKDRFIAYSAWMAYLAHDLAGQTEQPRFIFLIQEYEAIFHAHDSARAIVEQAYNLQHLAIFNTRALRSYFESQKLGIFGNLLADKSPEHKTFEHGLTEIQPPTVSELAQRNQRRFLFYARPEAHAGRNMFELGILALRKAIENGAFSEDWSFLGVGALSEGMTVDLGSGFTMPLIQKLDLRDYATALKGFDMGMSLMMAPHPSLLPYEMASAGLVVVTNNFDYRNQDFFHAISGNIYSAQPSINGLSHAIESSIHAVDNLHERVNNSNIDWHCSWDQAFSDRFIQDLISSIS